MKLRRTKMVPFLGHAVHIAPKKTLYRPYRQPLVVAGLQVG